MVILQQKIMDKEVSLTALRPRILLVDLDKKRASNIARICKAEGILVEYTNSSSKAFDVLESNIPDLILTACKLASIDGMRFCEILRENERYTNIPFWMIMDSDIKISTERILQAGIEEVFPFPLDTELLVHKLYQFFKIQSKLYDVRESHDALQAIEDNMNLVWWRYQPSTDNLMVSNNFYVFFGIPMERQPLGTLKQLTSYLPDGTRDKISDALEKLLKRKKKFFHAYSEKDGVSQFIFYAEYREKNNSFWGCIQKMISRNGMDLTVPTITPQSFPRLLLANDVLRDCLIKHLVKAEKNEQQVAVLRIHMEYFDKIDDEVSNQLFQMVIRRISKSIRNEDVISSSPEITLEDSIEDEEHSEVRDMEQHSVVHMGGDDIIVILSDIEDEVEATGVATRLLENFFIPFIIRGKRISINANIGIAIFPDNSKDATLLLKQTRAAVLQAKRSGNGVYCVFSNFPSKAMLHRLSIDLDLRKALELDQLILNYQPIVCAKEERTIGAEALIRWIHPTLGTILPNHFINNAEKSGLIKELGYWVIDAALKQFTEWRTHDICLDFISINISAAQLFDSHFSDYLLSKLRYYHIAMDEIVLEITESLFINRNGKSMELLRYIHALGIAIAIDDFGTGYSSLSYLQKLPVSILKIDGSFSENIDGNAGAKAILTTIINLAQELNLLVIAEGVETEKHVGFLRDEKCDYLQGFYFTDPLKAADFNSWYLERGSKSVLRCISNNTEANFTP